MLRQPLDAFRPVSPRSPPSGRLWDDYQSAALLIALPSVLNICEGNTFRFYAKLPAGSMGHDFLQGIDENIARRNPRSPKNGQRCATQHGGWKRNSRPSAVSNLNEAESRR